MEFEDQAIILTIRPYGEGAAIVTALTSGYGVRSAHVAGGGSWRMAAFLQPGKCVRMHWRARLEDQLGRAQLEPEPDSGAGWAAALEDQRALGGLISACVLTAEVLPEREPAPGVYAALGTLISLLDQEALWPYIYVRFELGLLEAIGFGLDLSRCAATGAAEDLVFVSPRSGRAVSWQSGLGYSNKLLKLPGFLRPNTRVLPNDIAKGLSLTGYFLEKHVFHPQNRPLPEVRARLVESMVSGSL